jgi:hypothetical protein
MIRKYTIWKACLTSFILSSTWACSNFDALPLEYKEDPALDVDASWQLERMDDTGSSDSRVIVYKDKLYNSLFTRTLGWNGGDGCQSTLLPDGNVFWTFNDSFYGVVNATTRARGTCNFPRNTVMIQTPGETDANLHWLNSFVQTTDATASHYYQARTFIRHPKASLTVAAVDTGSIDSDWLYWAGDATVYNGQLQMLWNGVDTTDPNNPMRHEGTCLATYSLSGKVGDGTYMSVISENHNFRPEDIYGYGSTLWEDEDGHTYLYCTYNYGVLVARSETHDLNSPWEYYISDAGGNFAWQTTYPTEAEVKRSQIQDTSCSMPWIFKKDNYYYMTGQSMWFGKDVYIMRSTTPYGPFTNHKTLFTVPSTLDKVGVQTYQHLYMINLHPHMSRAGELVFSTNTDTASFWDNFNALGSADFYRPYFYRVYKWEKLFDE